MIDYSFNASVSVDQLIDLYVDSMLGERRPVNDRDRMVSMIQNANLIVSAWDGDLLVGVARSMTDFSFATYLSDLAVRLSYQRRGIGTELIRRTQSAAPQASVILLSAPKAVDYYPRIGMKSHPSAWVLGPGETLRESETTP